MMPSCHRWSHERYCDAVSLEIAHFVEVVSGADPTARVPSCPDWSIADLLEHTGGIHRWVERMVREQTPKRIPSRLIELGLPSTKEALPGWLAEGGRVLVKTLRQADPDAPMWAWGADQHVRFWARRMLFETSVHRVDAELAVGRDVRIEVDAAVDGIDELLDNLPGAAYFAPNVAELRGDGESFRLLAADTGDTWLIELQPDRFTWRHDVATTSASVEVRGKAADLYLLLWRRRAVQTPPFEVSGDAAVLARWLERSAL